MRFLIVAVQLLLKVNNAPLSINHLEDIRSFELHGFSLSPIFAFPPMPLLLPFYCTIELVYFLFYPSTFYFFFQFDRTNLLTLQTSKGYIWIGYNWKIWLYISIKQQDQKLFIKWIKSSETFCKHKKRNFGHIKREVKLLNLHEMTSTAKWRIFSPVHITFE